jgi:hypothetical protein
MNNSVRFSLALLVAPLALATYPITAAAQFQSQPNYFAASPYNPAIREFGAPEPAVSAGGASTRGGVAPTVEDGFRPLSRVAFGVGISPLGIDLQATTNINRHLNVRAAGSLFNYTADNISTEGFNVTAKINMASVRASVDYYPFHVGFRLSPGVMFYNQNKADVTFLAASGTSFSLNDHNYYSASGANAVVGKGAFGLGNGSAAFTMTTGWGNVIPASGRHFSFPFEVGVAFIKTPTVALNLTGFVCDAQGQNCVNVATDPTAQADLAAQVQKYQNDFDPLKTYPIVSFGVAYNFRARGGFAAH